MSGTCALILFIFRNFFRAEEDVENETDRKG